MVERNDYPSPVKERSGRQSGKLPQMVSGGAKAPPDDGQLL
jgi:hypothetical protein